MVVVNESKSPGGQRANEALSAASETCWLPAVHTVSGSWRRRPGRTSPWTRSPPAVPSASPRTRRRNSDGRLCSSVALEVGKLSGRRGGRSELGRERRF